MLVRPRDDGFALRPDARINDYKMKRLQRETGVSCRQCKGGLHDVVRLHGMADINNGGLGTDIENHSLDRSDVIVSLTKITQKADAGSRHGPMIRVLGSGF